MMISELSHDFTLARDRMRKIAQTGSIGRQGLKSKRINYSLGILWAYRSAFLSPILRQISVPER